MCSVLLLVVCKQILRRFVDAPIVGEKHRGILRGF
jgi:hypothetical protein